MMTTVIPVTPCDEESFREVLSVPWLKDSIYPTGSKWGRRIADVKMSRLPQNLLGQVMLGNEEDQVIVVIFRWDRYDYMGWKTFPLTLTFPEDRIYEVEVPPSSKLPDGHSFTVDIDTSNTILRQRPQQKDRSIPRIVFNLSAPLNKQLTHSVRRLLKNVRKMTNLIQCTSLFLVIEDDAGFKEVQNSGIPNFPEAYAALRSGAFKADLLRYYLLYKYGGVYMDDKTFLRYSLDSEEMDIILRESTDMFIGYCRTTEISFIGARRGSPIMLKALETAISNVMARMYGNHRLSITGNLMFQRILQSDNAKIHRPYSYEWGTFLGEKVALLPIAPSDERIVHDDDILWQRQAIARADWPKPASYYANLWNQHLVYVDRNPEFILMRPPPITAERKREVIAYSITIFAFLCVGFLISRYPPISWI